MPPRRCFLVSTLGPTHSVARMLQPVHLIAEVDGRWMYSNRPD